MNLLYIQINNPTASWRGCGDPAESSGGGMQEEIRCRTRKASKGSYRERHQ